MISVLVAEIQTQISAVGDQTVPTLRKIRTTVSIRVKALEATEIIRLALHLISTPNVPRWFTYEVVHHHRKAMAALTETNLQQLGKGVATWDQVDTFACYLSGPAWREGQISDQVVHAWAVSPDRWWRRVAVVSTVALNNTARGGSGDPARTLALCDLVKKDRDDMVVKGLSWALRALATKEPEAVREFLQSNDHCLAARVLREVRNKLETGLKNPRGNPRIGESHAKRVKPQSA